MDIRKIIENSDLKIDRSKILFDEPMNKHTSFKVGGPAECFIKIDNIQDLKEILQCINENKLPLTVIGNGSNILVLDGGIKGIVLKIQIEEYIIKKLKDKVEVTVASGMKIGKLARIFLKEEISGFEELSGVPGTIGGAIRMNAGAHGKEMKDIVKTVKCIDYEGKEKIFTNQELGFGYRKSVFKDKKYIITEAMLELQNGDKEEIKQKIDEYANYRKEKQPIEYPSAGSTFKRGEDFITAKLIDEAGLKGYNIGGAEVSTKHSGFIINKKNATAKDILELVKYVKEEVYKKFGKIIELEIEMIGEE